MRTFLVSNEHTHKPGDVTRALIIAHEAHMAPKAFTELQESLGAPTGQTLSLIDFGNAPTIPQPIAFNAPNGFVVLYNVVPVPPPAPVAEKPNESAPEPVQTSTVQNNEGSPSPTTLPVPAAGNNPAGTQTNRNQNPQRLSKAERRNAARNQQKPQQPTEAVEAGDDEAAADGSY